jgi:hypothetical protein
VPAVLTPEERGPRAAWAYDARDRLNLSDAQVAESIPGPRKGEKYDPATIRKAETGEQHMSRPLWRKLTAFYIDAARTAKVALDPVPTTSDETPTGDMGALIQALTAHTNALLNHDSASTGRHTPEAESSLAEAMKAQTKAIEAQTAMLERVLSLLGGLSVATGDDTEDAVAEALQREAKQPGQAANGPASGRLQVRA